MNDCDINSRNYLFYDEDGRLEEIRKKEKRENNLDSNSTADQDGKAAAQNALLY